MTAKPPVPRASLSPALLFFLAHLYALAALFSGLGFVFGRTLLEVSHYRSNDPRVYLLLATVVVALWTMFLIRSIHTRSPRTRKRCIVFCVVGLIIGLLLLGLVGIFFGMLLEDERTTFLCIGFAVAAFYGVGLYRFIASPPFHS